MVGVVALLVVGPEQLPNLARTAGRWIGKARYFVHAITAEINREIKAEELKKVLDEQARLSEIDNLISETRQNFSLARESLQITPNHSPPVASEEKNNDSAKINPTTELNPHESQ